MLWDRSCKIVEWSERVFGEVEARIREELSRIEELDRKEKDGGLDTGEQFDKNWKEKG